MKLISHALILFCRLNPVDGSAEESRGSEFKGTILSIKGSSSFIFFLDLGLTVHPLDSNKLIN